MATRSVSFTAPSVPPTAAAAEYGVGGQELALLEQQLAQLRLRDGNYKPQMIGDVATLNFSPLADALAQKRVEAETQAAKAKQLDVAGRWAEEEARQLRNYFQTRDGGTKELPGPSLDGEPITAPAAGNPRAFEGALASPFPKVQAAAKRDADLYGKTMEKLVDRASLPSVQQAPGDLTRWTPKPEDRVVGDTLVRTAEGLDPKLAPGGGFTQEKGPNGELLNRNTLTNEVKGGGGVNQTINMPGASTIAEFIKEVPKLQEIAQADAKTLVAAQLALHDLGQGAQVGAGAGWTQTVRSFFQNRLGIASDSTTPTAALMGQLAQMTLSEMGGRLGAGISDADRNFVEQATKGSMEATPESLERMLAIRAAGAQVRLEQYNKRIEVVAGLAETPQKGEAVRGLFKEAPPKVGFGWRTPEAAASYQSILRKTPFEQELANVKELAKQGPQWSYQGYAPGNSPKSDLSKATSGSPEARRARLKALGINPVD